MNYRTAEEYIDNETHVRYNTDFTPKAAAIKAAQMLHWKSGPIIDPMCGSGNLLKAALEIYGDKGLTSDMLYGSDILSENIEQCENDPELRGAHFTVADAFKVKIHCRDLWKENRPDYCDLNCDICKKPVPFKSKFGKTK